MRGNWAKRVLFLADRMALVNQAVNAFKTHLPDASPVNLVTEKDAEGRVYVSTYPTMMGLIDETRDGAAAVRRRPLRPGRHRRGAPLGVPEVPGDLRLLRLAARRPDGDARRTRWTATPTACSTSRTACRPTPTRSTRR